MLDLGLVYLRFYQTFGRFPSDAAGETLAAAVRNGVYPSDMADAVIALAAAGTEPDKAEDALLERVREIYRARRKKKQSG